MTTEQLAALKEMAEAAQRQTPEARIWMRYEHGGGRVYTERDDPDNDLRPHRELIADFYDEANREYYAAFDPTTCLALLEEVERRHAMPTIVCLCGSTKFMEAFQEANLRLTIAGEIVLSVGTNTKSDAQLTRENYWADPSIKVRLDELHKRKIDLAAYVYVLNVGGYIGESTRSEIDYALCRGKEVRYLEQP